MPVEGPTQSRGATLFDAPALSHRHGPETERMAAERIAPMKSKYALFALNDIRSNTFANFNRIGGRTCEEIARQYVAVHGGDYTTALLNIRPRVSEDLAGKRFLVRDSGRQRDNSTVWIATTITMEGTR